jgi:hypothetical protein
MEIELETFDRFAYQLAIGNVAPNNAHFLRVKVDAHLVTERKPDANEAPEEKKKRDDEFSKQLEAQRKRLETEKGFEKWIYLVSDWSIEPLLKGHDDAVKKPSPSPSPSVSPSPSTSISPSPTVSPSPGVMGSPAPTPSPGTQPNASPSSIEGISATPSPTVSAQPTATPESSPIASVAPSPNETPAGTPSASPPAESITTPSPSPMP